jgi:N-dimethylarginine dimethylaminohydrolase
MEGDLGQYWARCGTRSEVASLRTVLLIEPPESLGAVENPDAALLLDRIDLGKIRAEYAELAGAYEAEGVTVYRYRPPKNAPPNVIFARDLFWASPEGAVVGRMASPVRAGEERLATKALADLEIPIRMTIGRTGLFEGADALWLGENLILFGIGRSNIEALEQLKTLGVQGIPVPVPMGVQHLLGSLNFLDTNLAALHPGAGPELREVLRRAEVEVWEVEDETELRRHRALNFVTLAPRKILMPDHCPRTRRSWESRGIEVRTVEVQEYLKAAGGPGCLTGILWRA